MVVTDVGRELRQLIRRRLLRQKNAGRPEVKG
jgi:hypothetical protein